MLGGDTDPFSSQLTCKVQATDFLALGPIYCFSEVSKNEHVLDPSGLPAPVLHMTHGQTYIPLSLLMMASLNKIRNNNNVKFIKVPKSVMSQTLDHTQFGDEEDLTVHEWW